jgi:NAD(P)-dependent dehydrogenase (short-subunit alcohol dehydrogenase family)
MSDTINFRGRVAIVTGAGGGLGRSHALALAARGCKLVVNDLGGAQAVVDEITAMGGAAIPDAASVTDPQAVAAMVAKAMETWGRVDILINNAGILRDKTFLKLTPALFEEVLDVHLRGSWICTQAVWPIMRDQAYGRVLFTTSSSGLYGNFGQANYSTAKAGVVGLMNTLHIEGAKYNIRVNCLSPAATTRMTEDLLPPEAAALLTPESVSPGAVFLVSEDAPSKTILAAGAGVFSVVRIVETPGIALQGTGSAEDLAAQWDDITGQAGAEPLEAAWAQTQKFTDTVTK